MTRSKGNHCFLTRAHCHLVAIGYKTAYGFTQTEQLGFRQLRQTSTGKQIKQKYNINEFAKRRIHQVLGVSNLYLIFCVFMSKKQIPNKLLDFELWNLMYSINFINKKERSDSSNPQTAIRNLKFF
jgi:hypothetical protein